MANLDAAEQLISSFPFASGGHKPSSFDLYAQLPPKSEAYAAIDAFYRSFAWQYV
jgi:hypothetical protein